MTLFAWVDEHLTIQPDDLTIEGDPTFRRSTFDPPIPFARHHTGDTAPYRGGYAFIQSARQSGKVARLLQAKKYALEFERLAIARGHKPFTPAEKRQVFNNMLILHAPCEPGTYVRQLHAMGMLDPHQATFHNTSPSEAPMWLRPAGPPALSEHVGARPLLTPGLRIPFTTPQSQLRSTALPRTCFQER